MTLNMILTTAVIVLMVAVIISDKLPFGAPPLIACALLVVLNQATVAEAYGGFVDKNVIMICGFMVCMAGFQKTKLISNIKNMLGIMAGKGGLKNYALLLLLIMFLTNFISGTAWYVLVLSVVSTIPYKKELPQLTYTPSRSHGYLLWRMDTHQCGIHAGTHVQPSGCSRHRF